MGRTKPTWRGPRYSTSANGNRTIRARARKALRERNEERRKTGEKAGPRHICKLGRRLAKARLFGRIAF